jgi:hypothetical protein
MHSAAFGTLRSDALDLEPEGTAANQEVPKSPLDRWTPALIAGTHHEDAEGARPRVDHCVTPQIASPRRLLRTAERAQDVRTLITKSTTVVTPGE